jgi:hypothetical protein
MAPAAINPPVYDQRRSAVREAQACFCTQNHGSKRVRSRCGAVAPHRASCQLRTGSLGGCSSVDGARCKGHQEMGWLRCAKSPEKRGGGRLMRDGREALRRGGARRVQVEAGGCDWVWLERVACARRHPSPEGRKDAFLLCACTLDCTLLAFERHLVRQPVMTLTHQFYFLQWGQQSTSRSCRGCRCCRTWPAPTPRPCRGLDKRSAMPSSFSQLASVGVY